jgi:hypothetical protein
MTTRGLHLASLYLTLQADTLRLDAFAEFDGLVMVGVTHNPKNAAGEQSPIKFCVPKKDRGAYTRAVAAFNAVMDEHAKGEAAKNRRRRERARHQRDPPRAP